MGIVYKCEVCEYFEIDNDFEVVKCAECGSTDIGQYDLDPDFQDDLFNKDYWE